MCNHYENKKIKLKTTFCPCYKSKLSPLMKKTDTKKNINDLFILYKTKNDNILRTIGWKMAKWQYLTTLTIWCKQSLQLTLAELVVRTYFLPSNLWLIVTKIQKYIYHNKQTHNIRNNQRTHQDIVIHPSFSTIRFTTHTLKK